MFRYDVIIDVHLHIPLAKSRSVEIELVVEQIKSLVTRF